MKLDISIVRAQLAQKATQKTYNQILSEYGLKYSDRYYLSKILNDETFDPPPRIKAAFGITEYRLVEACDCGEVHLKSRCPNRQRRYRDLFSIPENELAWMLENREPIS